jgi:hypothetical protein
VAECPAAVVWAACTKSPHRAIYPEARRCRAEGSKSTKGVSVNAPRRPFIFNVNLTISPTGGVQELSKTPGRMNCMMTGKAIRKRPSTSTLVQFVKSNDFWRAYNHASFLEVGVL